MPHPHHPGFGGLWLPLVTPFRDGALDQASLRRLVRHYAAEPLDGLILAATTGEGLTIDEDETERVVAIVADSLAAAGRRLPVFLGLCGSDTRRMATALARTASLPIDGHLIACPYYTRPSQAGMVRHFTALATATALPIMIYNIPYRTGVNLGNAAMAELAALPNIVGVKDCCADMAQSFDLIRRNPEGFAVLTGEDAFFHTMLAAGAQGGITASAHVAPRGFAAVRDAIGAGDAPGALAAWHAIADLPPLLFAEPSPAPIKHWLWRIGLIASPEVRLPMTPVSDALAARIDQAVGTTRVQRADRVASA
ncbi:4-hydroxy-tetrahydrodipicolinate synthase [Roseomonas sp. CECT 9278]|uniref:4-hydroxy-tetrahydrodipicolinate synthase n=1 Tax=Roseomonas sp. CECT 9278 TaxID=2845823 RepID=UPI001E650474|nr:4-hydroxy-tetrahydrodipicolinate synthase [Roseomonas sp. CECT 9278]CAH0310782.1 4-hydroxy-tetrahydrodipicolinate synthase [Roseomonas sp. CECT 9278]